MSMEDFKKEHPAGFCAVPADLDSLPVLMMRGGRFVAPDTVDLRDYCTRTEDQGSKPWCAAYTAAQWCENVKWRVNDYPEDVDPTWIYSYAKSVDGSPNTDGTTLVAVLEALLDRKMFNPDKCKVKVIGRIGGIDRIKYAVHKFGCALGAFNITDEWYNLSDGNTTSVTGNGDRRDLGGHAVLICGYNRDGVIIQNSWGTGWGSYGFGLITWNAFSRQFLYGAVLSNALDGLTVA